MKWLLVDCLVDSLPKGEHSWELTHTPQPQIAAPEPLRIEELPEGIHVETGVATLLINRGGFLPFGKVSVQGKLLFNGKQCQTVLRDAKGDSCFPRIQQMIVEEKGPLRATLRIEGRFTGGNPCRFLARLCFFAGAGLVRLRLTIHNPRKARHAGGLWDLGDPGSVLFRGLALELGLEKANADRMSWHTEMDGLRHSRPIGALEIYQDSSGGENWQSKNHLNREGRVAVSFRGYRCRLGGEQQLGLRASPVLAVSGPTGCVTVAVPEFWQQFPKALEVDGNKLRISLFPEQFADLYELQGGEQKTHTVWFHFGPPGSPSESALDWVHQPARAASTPEWNLSTRALDPFCPPAPDSRLDDYLHEVTTGPGCLLKRRELIDEYGWRNFGEIYADHETAYYQGPPPLISHFNNQYDVVLGTLLQCLRTGQHHWFLLGDPLARHVIDIDIYHTDRDKANYNGGLFWFTDHYKSAGTCTHRTYSKENCREGDSAYGGGPSSAHNFTTGLLHYYYLTGDPNARDAVIGLANWVINMDDGRQNLYGLVDEGPTGSASCTFNLHYQGPGRGAGNSINALIDACLLTDQRAYLDQAEAIIRRCIHPGDNVAALDLLNVELRWSYTVLLSVLARYLAFKRERDETDFMVAYARASLLHYAEWMVEHEMPYFDQVEKLEFPTEAWAAQELRKANVMRLAAGYADEPLRGRLLRRGEELANRAWQDLDRFPSRTVARAAAIIFVEGLRDLSFRTQGVPRHLPPPGSYDFGNPQIFMSQKHRVRAQLTSLWGLVRVSARMANPKVWLRAFTLLQKNF